MTAASELLDIGTPDSWGLPSKFAAFRQQQVHAICDLADAATQVRAGALPTGSGKTLIGLGLHPLLSSERSAYLTVTNGLLGQYLTDGASIGLTDIKGRRNYDCVSAGLDCEQGWAAGCWARNNGCDFNAQVSRMLEADRVVTNYHFWLTYQRAGKSLGPFDLLVCDEAHHVPTLLSDMSMRYIPHEAASPPGALLTDMDWWRKWASDTLPIELPDPKEDPAGYVGSKRWAETVEAVAGSGPDWIADEASRGWNMGPIWPARAARKDLFRGIKHIVMLSATVRPKTLQLMGLRPVTPEQLEADGGREPVVGESLFLEYPTLFDPARSPIYYYTNGLQLRFSMRSDEGQLKYWVSLLDAFMATRQDRKIIIHSVSYAWADIIKRYSRFHDRMLTHGKARELPRTLRRFKSSREPLVLVSPSVSTGFDFPDDDCRAQIISKLPFPKNSDQKNLAAARRKEDPDYDAYLLAQSLVQSVGRAMRSEDDWCETLIVDKQFGWFSDRNKEQFPAAFLSAVRHVGEMPDGQRFRFSR